MDFKTAVILLAFAIVSSEAHTILLQAKPAESNSSTGDAAAAKIKRESAIPEKDQQIQPENTELANDKIISQPIQPKHEIQKRAFESFKFSWNNRKLRKAQRRLQRINRKLQKAQDKVKRYLLRRDRAQAKVHKLELKMHDARLKGTDYSVESNDEYVGSGLAGGVVGRGPARGVGGYGPAGGVGGYGPAGGRGGYGPAGGVGGYGPAGGRGGYVRPQPSAPDYY